MSAERYAAEAWLRLHDSSISVKPLFGGRSTEAKLGYPAAK